MDLAQKTFLPQMTEEIEIMDYQLSKLYEAAVMSNPDDVPLVEGISDDGDVIINQEAYEAYTEGLSRNLKSLLSSNRRFASRLAKQAGIVITGGEAKKVIADIKASNGSTDGESLKQLIQTGVYIIGSLGTSVSARALYRAMKTGNTVKFVMANAKKMNLDNVPDTAVLRLGIGVYDSVDVDIGILSETLKMLSNGGLNKLAESLEIDDDGELITEGKVKEALAKPYRHVVSRGGLVGMAKQATVGNIKEGNTRIKAGQIIKDRVQSMRDQEEESYQQHRANAKSVTDLNANETEHKRVTSAIDELDMRGNDTISDGKKMRNAGIRNTAIAAGAAAGTVAAIVAIVRRHNKKKAQEKREKEAAAATPAETNAEPVPAPAEQETTNESISVFTEGLKSNSNKLLLSTVAHIKGAGADRLVLRLYNNTFAPVTFEKNGKDAVNSFLGDVSKVFDAVSKELATNPEGAAEVYIFAKDFNLFFSGFFNKPTKEGSN